MALNVARNTAVTTSPDGGGVNGGSVTDSLPRDVQLPLGSRISDEFGEESRRFLATLRRSLTANGRSLNDAAEMLGIDDSLLTRQVQGNGANISPRLLIYALWRDQTHTLARYLADLAGGEWKPKPPPDATHWLPLIREDLEKRGLWRLVAESVGYRPPLPEELP